MNNKQIEVIKKIGKENFVILIVITIILSVVVMAIFDSAKEYIHTDFECSVREYYKGNYSKALTEINNSDENNSIKKNYIRGLINYKLNKYQESLIDLNFVSQNIKSLNNDIFYFQFNSESIEEAFIKTNQIKGECKFYLNDYRGAIIDSNIAIDTLVKYQKKLDNGWLNNTYTSLHYYNAVSKYKLKNYQDALFSLNEVIEFKGANNFPKTYLYKGLIEIQNRNKDSACINFSKAGELGCKEAYTFIKKYCN